MGDNDKTQTVTGDWHAIKIHRNAETGACQDLVIEKCENKVWAINRLVEWAKVEEWNALLRDDDVLAPFEALIRSEETFYSDANGDLYGWIKFVPRSDSIRLLDDNKFWKSFRLTMPRVVSLLKVNESLYTIK